MTSGLASPVGAAQVPAPMTGKTLALHDLSLALRSGVRGPGAADWLRTQSMPTDLQPNTIENISNGRLLMALSTREFWLLEPDADASAAAPPSAAVATEAWPLYNQHSHAWLVLAGGPKADMMAKLCGVDLRENAFALGQVAQTQMAHISVIVAHHLWRDTPVFSMFVDQSLADFAWTALSDAMSEFRASTD
ncbi:MAG: hypothetical protein L7T24_11080 [Luminiphilus sp.]|nr:hypothetical protein [Luminiphilus sp.]